MSVQQVDSVDLSNYRRIAFLLGAGASTSAGIPDFRSAGGIYEKYGRDLFTADAFLANPGPLISFLREYLCGEYEPTATHRFIKEVQDAGKLWGVVTQNIDGLEDKVGLDDQFVYPVHGTLSRFSCVACRTEQSADAYLELLQNAPETVPTCADCQSLLRPKIVMFGEELDHQTLEDSQCCLAGCDLFICIGTSLKVEPVCNLPWLNVPETAKCIWINRDAPPKMYARFFDDLFLDECDTVVNKFRVV